MHMRHIVICGLPGCAVFFPHISSTARFSKEFAIQKLKD
jgi:hypothetical protein